VSQAHANQARARFAEDLVAAWYVTEGYEVIARNWRCPRGELDIVAWRNNVLVVCEVKARRNADFGDPFESITPRKMLRVRRATGAFVESLRLVHDASASALIGDHEERASRAVSARRIKEIRFDAASVVGTRVEVRSGVL
jgi:putative endonuclease